jgi:protein-S-isoprenylcysteine O-methyltransferase Ste14
MPQFAQWLYLVPLLVVAVGWVGFILIFTLRGRKGAGNARKADRGSIVGVFFQIAAFSLVWSMHRRPFTPIVYAGIWCWVIAGIISIVLTLLSLWMMWSAVHALGKQWSLQARVLEEHALITAGPYRLVRHPIYTGMLGMLIAAGLAYSSLPGLIAALMLFGVGVWIRVRSEEKLLREKFGQAYADYAGRVWAIIPIPHRRAASPGS